MMSNAAPQPQRRATILELATLLGFCAFLFYFGLAAFGLVGADEPRYAQIAREMLARHDWVTPILYGHPWLEKPPLYYWRAMASYWLFGVGDWAARLPSATAATVMVFVIYFFARRHRRGAQVNAALFTAASIGVIGFARGAGTDMQLAATFVIGMLAWYAWQETGRRLWLAFFYVFMALGTLAKGPVAPVLAGLVIVAFALVRREARLILRTLWIPGILLFLAIALPWYMAVQRANPGFLREFFLQHNLERFATNRYHHKQPAWYFVPVLMLGVMPWTALAVAAIVNGLRGWRRRTAAIPAEGTLPMFLVLWVGVVLLFYAFSQSKLPGYILPAVPACTLLAAEWLERRQRLHSGLMVAQGFLSAVLLSLALLYPTVLARGPVISREARWVTVGVAAMVFFATVETLRRRGPAMLRLVALAPVIVGLGFLLRAGAPAIDNALSARPVAREIAQIEAGKAEVAVFRASRETEYGLAWYRNHGIARYERGEVPAGDHLVVVPEKYAEEVAAVVRPRRVSRVGGFAPQHLEFLWVSRGMEHH